MPEMQWLIDWRIEGTIQIVAADADEAQEIFDRKFGSPSFLDPLRDGEISNNPPYRSAAPNRQGGDNGDPS
jgi:hypothetical protein